MMEYGSGFDACYITGNYNDLPCEICPHRSDCSGYEEDDDED